MAKPVLLSLWVLFVLMNQNNCLGDVDSGCPSWGCLPWGSFSLSAGVPSLNSTIPWSVNVETVSASTDDARVPRGCVSDQETVVCTTQSGYVSIDPTNGKTLWNYTTKSPPYLPIMDIYGDVIGMDVDALYYVGADGKPKHPINVAILKPMYSLMVGNDSIMLLTGSTNKTAQIITYLTAGIVDGAIPLKESIENMNGTFIPCSQPIISGFRAYIMTYFLPDDSGSEEAHRLTGMLRLYAIDLLHHMAPRIVIAWYFNFGKWSVIDAKFPTSFPHVGWHPTQDGLDPIVTYFGGNVYVNIPGGLEEGHRERTRSQRQKQPYPSSLWAIRDDGNGGSLLFRKTCFYGPMAVYDTYFKPLSKPGRVDKGDEEHLLWIMNRSPAMIQGYDAFNGTFKKISGFDTIFEKIGGRITSRLSITRSNTSPENDQLVFGTSDSSGQASISVVQVSGNQAKLFLSRVVGGGTPGGMPGSTTVVEGQIVNFVFYPPKKNGKRAGTGAGRENFERDALTLGLAVMVKESNSTSISRTVVGVF